MLQDELFRPRLTASHVLESSCEKEVLKDIYQALYNIPISPLVDSLNINDELFPMLYGLNYFHLNRFKCHKLLESDVQHILNAAFKTGIGRMMPWRESSESLESSEELDLLNPYPSRTRRQRIGHCRWELKEHILPHLRKDPLYISTPSEHVKHRAYGSRSRKYNTNANGFATLIAKHWGQFSRKIVHPTRFHQYELF